VQSIARLQLITPPSTDASVVARTRAALAAGASWVQVRTKPASDRARLDLPQRGDLDRIESACAERGATCLVDDRVDLALAVGAAGVHVGADDLPVALARRLLGPDALIGATCRTADDVARAADEGADYVGVGPVHATTTKAGLPDPIGAAGLAAITRRATLPVIAISGITVARVAEVLDAGAHGVAVVGAVYDAPDIDDAVASLLDLLPVGSDR
jgi:thiamine-phosphate pyrophosphorylase